MGRQKMVTRTVESITAEVMCLNITSAEVSTMDFTLSADTVKRAKSEIDAFKSVFETESFKLVAITAMDTTTKLYGMTEAEFLTYARELPPRKASTDDTELLDD